MSERLGFSVDIEGAEETIAVMNTMVTQVNTVVTLVDRASETTELFEEVRAASDETLKHVADTAEETTRKLGRVRESLGMTDLKEFTRDASMLLGTLASVDYLWMSWTRAAERFDIRTFISTLLSTISFIRRLTTLIELATAKQKALNVAQAAGGVTGMGTSAAGLTGITSMIGPIGMAIAILTTISLGIYSVVSDIQRQNALLAAEIRKERESRETRRLLIEKFSGEPISNEEWERRRRESYRSVVPG